MSRPVIRIGNRAVGPGHPAYVVAEIGINHNGDIDLARRTIDAAKAAGADAVKFQNYRTEDFIADRNLTYSYVGPAGTVTENLFGMFKRSELSDDMLGAIAAYCTETGIDWHSTPTSADGVALLADLGAPVLKNGSDYLGHLELIEAMGRTGLPVVLSTGMATLSDIDDAATRFLATGNRQLIILHCTSQYPTAAAEANLRRVSTLAASFDCFAGFSDHTEGTAASVAAVTLGAVWIEKHFTLDRSLPGSDHAMSADPEDFARLVRDIRFTEEALGTPAIELSGKERAARAQHRLSCGAARDMAAGETLARADIRYMRPGTGIAPRDAPLLVGRRLRRAVAAGSVFGLYDLD